MNSYALNTRVLGNGVTVPNKFWTAVAALYVVTAEGFAVLTGAAWSASQGISAVGYANFTRFAAMAASQSVQMAGVSGFTRIQKLVANALIQIDSVAGSYAGQVKNLVSSVTSGVVSVAKFARGAAFSSAVTIVESAVAAFGKRVSMSGTRQVQVTTTAAATTFGTAAPVERQIIVPEQDRNIEVI